MSAPETNLGALDLEAEQSVLGAVLLMPEMVPDLSDELEPGHFGRAIHGAIFAAMQRLHQAGDAIDMVTLGAALAEDGRLAEVGGLPYLTLLSAQVPTSSAAMRYARIVREKAVRRAVASAGMAAVTAAREESGTADEVCERAEAAIFAATSQRAGDLAVPHVGPALRRVYDSFATRYEAQSDVTGIRTGLGDLDAATAGLHPGDLIIIAGRPSMGKTAVAMNIAAHVALREAQPVLVFSLEMSADSLVERMIASEARVDSQRVRTGRFEGADWAKLARAAETIHKAPLHIDDTGNIGTGEIRAKARRLKAKRNGLALVVVDYLQLMRGGSGAESREQAVSEILRGLKACARELGCPVIALSQLSRAVEKREDKRPILSDLRESGSIEQDADLVCFMYRDEYYDKGSNDKGIAELIIGKQRNGPTTTVPLAFLNAYTRFENLTPEAADAWRQRRGGGA